MGRRPHGTGPSRPHDGKKKQKVDATAEDDSRSTEVPTPALTSVELSALKSSDPEAEATWEAMQWSDRTRLQWLTRVRDWRDGGLSTAFFCQRLRETKCSAGENTKASVMVFTPREARPADISGLFGGHGLGRRIIRQLATTHFMVSFQGGEGVARSAITSIAADENAHEMATKGWLPSRADSELYVRYLCEDDLEQPLFKLPAVEYDDSDVVS